MRSFDCAEVYAHGKAEEILGKSLKEIGVRREDVIISTKIFFGDRPSPAPTARGLSRKHIIEGLKSSLKRLDLEYVDLIFAHRPDPETPIEETVRAFNYCISQGLCFYWGTSEWSAAQIAEAWKVADDLGLIGPTMEQPQYSMLHRFKVESEYADLYAKYGLGLTTWSPLASGVLTGKYSPGVVPEGSRFTIDRYKFLKDQYLVEQNLVVVEALKPIAEELKCTLPQLSLAWCLSNENVSTVIMGASKIEQLNDNLKSLEVLPKLNEMIKERIHGIIPAPSAV